ncbi:hypothetical protein [Mesobacillus stamsii]|uniref:Uncharacterized protein n=1 Tax=Mesobacillus stamsii TaxID=225347 RepID=A0ABU0FZG3_9BACI|nr:hypothetical protein [Mesobacillus stamsii]MDQ0414729.1 hypothetical protein [Mesobacillus stamsii]
MIKKTIITGALAAALIAAGGTGLYMASAKENAVNPAEFMKEQGIDFKNRANIMGDGNFGNMQEFMGEQGITIDEINQMRKSGDFEDMQKFMDDQNINFGQMQQYMQEMHPDLSTKDLEDMYKGMHGTGGASNSQNFQGIGNTGL